MTHPANSPSSSNDDSDTNPNSTENVCKDTPLTFRDLALSESVQQAVSKSGYESPSSIQAAVIPFLLDGRDVIGQAQTGTGKTAAFALPALSRIDPSKSAVQVLVLAPTRELALQVSKSFSTYGSCMKGLSVLPIYGGQDYEPQLRQLRRGVQVVVGTPGRVIDHIKRGTLSVKSLDCLVLDEADEMLNMGFLEDVQFVLDQTPSETQIALFSATLPEPIRRIAKKHLKNPETIQIKQRTMTAASIRQRALYVTPRQKPELLMRLLEAEQTDGVIVFAKTKESTTTLADELTRSGYAAAALNGDMPQGLRERTVQKLKSGDLNILVATDVAARGLDVSRISHVINYDAPHDNESYVHRIGRTGRAGRSGEAILLLSKGQTGRLKAIERLTRQSIEIVHPPSTAEINKKRVDGFKERIRETIAEKDVTFFKQMINEYAETSGHSVEMVAAALADMAQNGRPLLLKDVPKAKRVKERSAKRDFDNSYESDRPSNRRSSRGAPVREGMQRFRVEVGHVDGLKPGNLVGAIANEAGIEGRCIGPINIETHYSTVDLPEGMPNDIFQTLRRTWVVGKQLEIRGFDDRKSHDGGSSHKGKRKPFSKNGGAKRFAKGAAGEAGAKFRKKKKNKKKAEKAFAK
ncbi:ATP-dependent RNA helicase DeaD [Novipirellula aureliae]|uniref:ATP-dependent RNA helicase DeaD n=1 Tax=Novipirellula aureliae TaxID=2527966 RepID=A0A5C6DTD3_9BACT|nr:DEAD/DEAH box helicase [Novipirellula aureliae]TWU39942.1 ATP-dependent RNA helicase DeaD [Novipirellula aureliae]